MRLRALIVPLLAAALLAAAPRPSRSEVIPPAPEAAAYGLGPVTATTLPNGLKVLVAPSQASDLVTLDLWMDAGTRRETADNNGAAHFMEHLLFKGTPTRPPGQIDAAIENLGGSLNAATSYDWAHFFVTVGAEDAPAALAVMADGVMNAALRQEDMDRERAVILAEMAREQSTPGGQMTRVFNTLTFPDNAYGRPLLGTESSISQMPRQTVVDFYQKYYVPGDAALVITGRITPEAGLALAKSALGAWPARPVPPNTTRPVPLQQDIRTPPAPLPGSGSQAFLMIGWRAPSVTDGSDPWAMDVLLTLLGQAGNNRLDVDLRRKQKIVTSISANYLTQRDPGAMTITASFAPGYTERVRSAILDETRVLREAPISENDLAAAKRALLASYLFDAQTTSGRADALGFYNTIDTYQYDTGYVSHFLAVTAADVQRVAQKYLNPQAYTLVTLLPPSDPVTASRR